MTVAVDEGAGAVCLNSGTRSVRFQVSRAAQMTRNGEAARRRGRRRVAGGVVVELSSWEFKACPDAVIQ